MGSGEWRVGTDFVVRIRVQNQGQASEIYREIKKGLREVTGCRYRDKHLIVELGQTEDVDRVLVELRGCLGKISCFSGKGPVPEIVETRLCGLDREAVLPGDIYLDPVFSFGSGNHPSTSLAVSLLEKSAESGTPGRVLDVGCGSGILGLLAARFGAVNVLGVEIDPESVTAARKNVEANNLEKTVFITDQDLSVVRGAFDLILANLTASVFYRLEAEICRLAAGKARLIVSGLQGRQVKEAAERLERRGWTSQRQESSGRWRALLMAKQERGGK
ncbi:MAG: 50S ribosomal protein L11 methyltransferase [Desulfurivibrionaceae bacterium]